MRTKSVSRIAVALVLICLSSGLVFAQDSAEADKGKNAKIVLAVDTTPDVLIAGETHDLLVTVQNATATATKPLHDGDVFVVTVEMEGAEIVEISPEVFLSPEALDETRLSATAGSAPDKITVRYSGPDMPFGPGSAFTVKLKYSTPNITGAVMVSVQSPADRTRFKSPWMWFDALMVGDESTVEVGTSNGSGAAGPAGPAGPAGSQGERGLQGDTGAAGPQGPTGATGATGAAGQRGAQGDAGAPGPQGPQGSPGSVGPAGATGAKGDTGAHGPQGIAGLPGLKWRSDWSAATSYEQNDAVSYQGSSWIALRANQNATPVAGADWSLVAQKGEAGTQGVEGAKGDSGVQGEPGPMGPTGPQGLQGLVGPQGVQGVIGPQGIQGLIGPQGLQGLIGPQGIQGLAGKVGLVWKQVWDNTTSYQAGDAVSYLGSSWIALRDNVGATPIDGLDWAPLALQGLVGPQGVQGLIGPQGVQGLIGPQGLQGLVGPQGVQGLIGPQGIQGLAGKAGLVFKKVWSAATTYEEGDAVTFLGSTWIALRESTGVSPVDGLDWAPLALQGIQGLTGPDGPLGPQGLQGVQGLLGPQGPLGPIGEQGIQGVQGLVGKAGVVWKKAWDVAKSYDEGDAVSFDGASWIAVRANVGVTPVDGDDWSPLSLRGLQGVLGPEGPIGPQGLTGPQGLLGPEGAIGQSGAQGIQGIQGLVGKAGLVWKKAWDVAKSYDEGGAVSFDGASWIAVRANVGVTPVDGDDWSPLSLRGLQGLVGPAGSLGPQGLQGVAGTIGLTGPAGPLGAQGLQGIQGLAGKAGLVWKRDWSAATSYDEGDAVTYNGESWIALRANVGVTPVDGDDWSPLSLRGLQGLTGPQGLQGLTGPQGLQGLTGSIGLTGATGPQGSQGLQGIQGLTGATGAGGILGAVYAYASAPAITGLGVSAGSAIQFSTTGSTFGGFSVTGGGTGFVVPANGIYRVQFSGSSSLVSLLGGARIALEGIQVGQTMSLITVGAPIQGEVIVTATAGQTISVVGTGLGITLAPGSGFGVTIMRLQ